MWEGEGGRTLTCSSQAEAMTRFYRTAVLLIEFDEGRPFSLQARAFLPDIRQPLKQCRLGEAAPRSPVSRPIRQTAALVRNGIEFNKPYGSKPQSFSLSTWPPDLNSNLSIAAVSRAGSRSRPSGTTSP